jgi:glucose/arabinose dehydrogenase
MRRTTTLRAALAVAGATALLAACGSSATRTGEDSAATMAPAPVAAGLVATPLRVPSGNGGGAFSTARKLLVPKGWTAEVWARVTGARMEAWTPEGDLLVSVPSAGTVVELVPGRQRSTPPSSRTILRGLTGPQGLAFARVDGREVLYVGEYDRIDRYAWDGRSVAGAPRILAAGYPWRDGYHHPAKDIAVGRDGTVYFNVGSATNATPSDRAAHPAEAVVMAVRPDGHGLHVVARGVRNSEGLAVAPDGVLWGAVNNRDQETYPFHGPYDGTRDAFGRTIQAYVDGHPPDEVASITPGRDLGWPYCNPDQDVNDPVGSLADVPLVADAVANPSGRSPRCASLPPIQVGLPAHSAPLGLSFLEGSRLPAPWSDGAVVAVHGSWDRNPPRSPAVLWMGWDAKTRSLLPARTVVSGFQSSDGSRWGRVADAVAGPDGALYVSDDTAGAIYRLVPTGA